MKKISKIAILALLAVVMVAPVIAAPKAEATFPVDTDRPARRNVLPRRGFSTVR